MESTRAPARPGRVAWRKAPAPALGSRRTLQTPHSSAGATTPAFLQVSTHSRASHFPVALPGTPISRARAVLALHPELRAPRATRTLPESGPDTPARGGPAVWSELAAVSRCCCGGGRSLSKAPLTPLCIIHSDGRGAFRRTQPETPGLHPATTGLAISVFWFWVVGIWGLGVFLLFFVF